MGSSKYSTLFLCLILTILVSTVLSMTIGRKCREGQTHFDGCNNCFCSGGNMACTLMLCYEIDPARGVEVMKKVIDPPESFWQPAPEVKYPTAHGKRDISKK